MNKRELKKWLDDKRKEKLKKLKEEYAKSRKSLLATQLESCGVDSLIEKAVSLGKDADGWVGDYGERFSVYTYGYNELTCWARLNKTPEELKRKIISDIDSDVVKKNNPEVMELYKKYEEAQRGIDDTYTALIANITLFKTSKEAIKYLKELGLEVPEDEPTMCTAVMVPVDTKYLFLDKN